jgi:hypothetical protein
MMDLGHFRDERLKKGRIFWRRSRPSARLACGDSAATEGYRGFLHNEAVTRQIMLSEVDPNRGTVGRWN